MKEIIINKQNDKKQILLLEDGELKEKYIESTNIRRIERNIYVGKVKDVLSGMQAAFIDIGLEKSTFIHLQDILPKIDITKEKKLNNKDVKKIVKPGMPIIVQVKKDFTDSKGAKVSTHLSLDSRYLVFMPNTEILTISKKIENEEEKERLLKMVKKYLPKNCGAIVRTSAENQPEEIIKKDIENIVKKWKDIEKLSKKIIEENKYPRIIYKTHGIIKKLLLDLIDKDLKKIEVNSKEDYEYLKKTLRELDTDKITIDYKEKEDLLENKIDLNKQLEKSEKRKVWLKCGGFIAIDKTEALTAIDVNSGKYIGKDNAESTIFKVNKQASIEIAKQLRLRDIGGIIIIDYIDMNEEENKKKVIEILSEELKKDRSKTQVVGFSKLNLLEMTRKHICSSDEN